MRLCSQLALAALAAFSAVLAYVLYSIFKAPVELVTSTPEIIRAAGYPSEEHKVQTEDGYILTVFRIPHGKDNNAGPKPRPPFWLQHGLTGSSDQFVQLGPEKALAFLLADNGYDVWLGNARGNRYSNQNIHFTLEEPQFWDFSWDEMGYYDLPADVTYVLKTTNQKKIYYAGHSMGVAMLMVFLSTRPEYQDKIHLAFALAPAVFLGHSRSVIFNYFCKYYSAFLFKTYGPCPVLPRDFPKFQNWLWPHCSPDLTTSTICKNVYELINGPTNDLNPNSLPTFLSTNPSQTSAKTAAHYGQSIETGEFRAFDYATKGNIKKYGSSDPPAYDLKGIKTPTVIMFAAHDYIASPHDAYEFCLSFGNPVEYYRVPHHKFDHADFLYGESAKKLVYNKILEIIAKGPDVLTQKAKCYNDTDIN